MNTVIIFFIGAVVGLLLGRNRKAKAGSTETLIERQGGEKAAHKERILTMFETKTRLTNNDVEKALGVSDSTATRYLEELEKVGKVRQVGTTGRDVQYERR